LILAIKELIKLILGLIIVRSSTYTQIIKSLALLIKIQGSCLKALKPSLLTSILARVLYQILADYFRLYNALLSLSKGSSGIGKSG
jgi:hypothetical protein